MHPLLVLFVAACPLPEPTCDELVSIRHPSDGAIGFPRDGLLIVDRTERACASVSIPVTYELTADDGTRFPLRISGKPKGTMLFAHDLLPPNTRFTMTISGGGRATFTTGETTLELPAIEGVSLALDTAEIEGGDCEGEDQVVWTSELLVQFSGSSSDPFLIDVAYGPNPESFSSAQPLSAKGASVVDVASLGPKDRWESDRVCARVRIKQSACLGCDVSVDERETCAPLPQSCATARGAHLSLLLLIVPISVLRLRRSR